MYLVISGWILLFGSMGLHRESLVGGLESVGRFLGDLCGFQLFLVEFQFFTVIRLPLWFCQTGCLNF